MEVTEESIPLPLTTRYSDVKYCPIKVETTGNFSCLFAVTH